MKNELVEDVIAVMRMAEREAKKELKERMLLGEKLLRDAKKKDMKFSTDGAGTKSDSSYVVKSFEGLINSMKELDRIIKAEPKEPPKVSRDLGTERWIYDATNNWLNGRRDKPQISESKDEQKD